MCYWNSNRISSFCYLLICAVTAYLRNITITPNFINDWISFLFTNFIRLILFRFKFRFIFSIEINYMRYLINSGFTFFYIQYFYFYLIFRKENQIQIND